jgi:hypothetical protein
MTKDKKSFKGSPALQFITPEEAQITKEASVTTGVLARQERRTKTTQPIDLEMPIAPTKILQTVEQTTNKIPIIEKIMNIDKQFTTETSMSATIEESVPMKLNPLYVETKSKRFQLLLQPSVYNKVKELALASGISVNEFIHTTLEVRLNGQK